MAEAEAKQGKSGALAKLRHLHDYGPFDLGTKPEHFAYPRPDLRQFPVVEEEDFGF